MTPIKGFTDAQRQINTDEHNVRNTIAEDAVFDGGKLTFLSGAMINGTIDNCELISCRGTLIIGETAKVNRKRIEADCLINLGNTIADQILLPGTLVAWSGSITGKEVQYAAFEKSARCAVKVSLDEITGQPIPVPAPAFIVVPELEPPKRLKAVALESTADTETSPA